VETLVSSLRHNERTKVKNNRLLVYNFVKDTMMTEPTYVPSTDILELAKNHQIQFINACWDDEGIYFYQAFNNKIADYAIENQKVGGPNWGATRMTWIKPSFGWMLYRCGYGKKHGQNRVLKIKLSHETFSKLLAQCSLTVHSKDPGAKSKTKEKHNKSKDDDRDSSIPQVACKGRVQWDPERDLFSSEGKCPRKMLNTRAIQIGLFGGLSQYYCENIISIEDVSELAADVGIAHSQKSDQKVTEKMDQLKERLSIERPYWPALNTETVLKSLGLIPGEHAELLSRIGKGAVKIIPNKH
uniref:Uncharacterized protein n=2 Tax=Clytia hemisphaerica TaxID=252671 RepID=A0A7M5UMH2_9CNID